MQSTNFGSIHKNLFNYIPYETNSNMAVRIDEKIISFENYLNVLEIVVGKKLTHELLY